MLKDLHLLPKFRDSLSYLYLEHGRIDQRDLSVAFYNKEGVVPVPVASLAVLMLGPGTKITHAAIRTLAENNCLVIWCGEENVRFYAAGTGGTRSGTALLYQAWLASDPKRRMEVVRRMYQARFPEPLEAGLSLQQIRGMEGLRVRASYARLSEEHGVTWSGRNYDRSAWHKGDVANRAISAANACLYGLCHAAILSIGLSPAIGFIHTGKQLSFVYDVADLYKAETTLPIAFRTAAERPQHLEREVRRRCRDTFREARLVARIVPDIQGLVATPSALRQEAFAADEDPALPAGWWDPEEGEPPALPPGGPS